MLTSNLPGQQSYPVKTPSAPHPPALPAPTVAPQSSGWGPPPHLLEDLVDVDLVRLHGLLARPALAAGRLDDLLGGLLLRLGRHGGRPRALRPPALRSPRSLRPPRALPASRRGGRRAAAMADRRKSGGKLWSAPVLSSLPSSSTCRIVESSSTSSLESSSTSILESSSTSTLESSSTSGIESSSTSDVESSGTSNLESSCTSGWSRAGQSEPARPPARPDAGNRHLARRARAAVRN